MQFLTAVSPQSFSTPSWKVETKYSTRVLTGNWVEERRKFTKATEKTPQCIYREEYVPFPGHRPDQISRWYGKRRIEGLPYKHLITHHQEPSHRHLISTYDDHYNRHNYNPGLPPRRAWSGHKLLWLPEKSDFPLLGIRLIWDFALCWAGRGPRLPRAVDAERLTQRALE
ncbi:cilia- and flagella-associated protein 107 [Ursus arctos]|uniref:cilia- and flagella-associated protein 107 n=1 Tax=Ursus arctos TaxID=9644 RepID=UPI00254707CF|nr:cilia- and flagella-associated protein 107 [Ursus arctos]